MKYLAKQSYIKAGSISIQNLIVTSIQFISMPCPANRRLNWRSLLPSGSFHYLSAKRFIVPGLFEPWNREVKELYYLRPRIQCFIIKDALELGADSIWNSNGSAPSSPGAASRRWKGPDSFAYLCSCCSASAKPQDRVQRVPGPAGAQPDGSARRGGHHQVRLALWESAADIEVVSWWVSRLTVPRQPESQDIESKNTK